MNGADNPYIVTESGSDDGWGELPPGHVGTVDPERRREEELLVINLAGPARANRGKAKMIDRCARPKTTKTAHRAYKNLTLKAARLNHAAERLRCEDIKFRVRTVGEISGLYVTAIFL